MINEVHSFVQESTGTVIHRFGDHRAIVIGNANTPIRIVIELTENKHHEHKLRVRLTRKHREGVSVTGSLQGVIMTCYDLLFYPDPGFCKKLAEVLTPHLRQFEELLLPAQ